MTGNYVYAVLGSGRQGVAAAYDLAKWGNASSILMADVSDVVAAAAAQRINRLVNRDLASPRQVDVRDQQALVDFLQPVDVCVCAVPFIFIPACTQASIEARTSMVDLGGHTETVLKQLTLNEAARAAGVSIVPDCGMGPGMNNTLGIYTVEQLLARGASPREVRIWDGGLPQIPPPPWGYQSSFHINGLTNEYDGYALFLRNGRVTPVEAMTEPEMLNFTGIGQLEAFVTSGGTSTVPLSYEGRLQVYENKTLRYPGHYVQFKAFKDLGLFRQEPLTIAEGQGLSPRQVYHALLGPMISTEQVVVDVCVMRAQGVGEMEGKDLALVIELIDVYDKATGFSAMERITGWHAAIMAQFIAQKAISPGVWPLEKAISAQVFLEEVRKRGFSITEQWKTAEPVD